MPKIPDSSQLGYSTPRTQKAPRIQRGADPFQSAVSRFVDTADKLIDQHEEKQDAFSYAQAKSKYTEADIAARKEVEAWYEGERAKSKEPEFFSIAPQELQKRYAESMRKAREESSALVRGKRDRALFEMDTKVSAANGDTQVLQFGKQMEVKAGRASLSSMLESNRTLALEAQDQKTREGIINNVNEAIQGAVRRGYVQPDEANTQRKAWTLSFAEGYIDTQSTDKQVEVLSKPEGTPASLLQPDRRAVLLTQAKNQQRIERDRAKAEKDAAMVKVRQALSDEFQDITAGAEFGESREVPAEGIWKAAFGDREGERLHLAARNAQKMSGDVAQFHQMPTEKIQKTAESYRPDADSGVGLAYQRQAYSSISNGAQNILKARKEDPAGYLTKYAPASEAAWKAFMAEGTEESRDEYLASIDADRERLGMAKGDVLPNTYAKSLANEITSEKSPEKLVELLGAEAARWGDRWGDVHAQVAKDLPDIGAMIGSGMDKAAAIALASTMGLKEAQLQEMLPPGVTLGAFKARVDTTFNHVRKAFPAEAARTWNALHDSAVRLSLSYMQAGDSESNAVDRAYKELITRQYDVGEIKNVTFLLPEQFNVNDIEEEAQNILENPPKKLGLLPRAEEDFRKNAYFVMSGKGDGLRVYMGANPTAIFYSFDELSKMSEVRRQDIATEARRLRGEEFEKRGGF